MFDEEYKKTSEKMSNAVLEYAAQFIAEDYLEAFHRAKRKGAGLVVPKALDDAMYEEIDKLAKHEVRLRQCRTFRHIFHMCLFVTGCIALGALILLLSISPIREAILQYFGL